MENPTKMDDLGVPPFSETTISVNLQKQSINAYYGNYISRRFRMMDGTSE